MGVCVHICVHVHVCVGHALDLFRTQSSEELIADVSVTKYETSDHFGVLCSLLDTKPNSVKKDITYHTLKAIDVKQFEADVMASNVINLDSINLEEDQ